jgi:hypothetical protein
MPRGSRSNSGTPMSSSSMRIWRSMAEAEIDTSRAAACTEPSWATAAR